MSKGTAIEACPEKKWESSAALFIIARMNVSGTIGILPRRLVWDSDYSRR